MGGRRNEPNLGRIASLYTAHRPRQVSAFRCKLLVGLLGAASQLEGLIGNVHKIAMSELRWLGPLLAPGPCGLAAGCARGLARGDP
jgi:hypothetical protein